MHAHTFLSTCALAPAHATRLKVSATAQPLLCRGLKVLRSIGEVRLERQALLNSGVTTVGLVPTMGALHSGHVELAKHSLAGTQATFVSIFVNPTQFLPHEDLNIYPRQLEKDLQLLTEANVQYAFCPTVEEMYPQAPPLPPPKTFVSIDGIDTDVLEGKSRPGHFRGVATVVSKLFNIVQPSHAYFGQKDGIQCIVLQRMIRELNFPVSMQVVPTLRAEDGLALSSRNVYLSPEERKLAPIVYKSLQMIEQKWDATETLNEPNASAINGNTNSKSAGNSNPTLLVTDIKSSITQYIERESHGKLKVQYISVASTLTGEEIPNTTIIGNQHDQPFLSYLISLAVYNGNVRLIDNVILKPRIKLPTEY